MRILFVGEDETILREVLPRLQRDGHRVWVWVSMQDVPDFVLAEGIHLVVLEPALLPFHQALELCRTLRHESAILIFLVSRLGGVSERVLTLRAGADDYLIKPFDRDELLARIEALLRRHPLSTAGAGPESVRVTETLWLDLDGRRLLGEGGEVALTDHEFRLLAYLVRHEGVVLTRERLLQAVWGAGYEGAEREVDVYVYFLRRKLEPDPKRPRYLLTMWGRGYRYERPVLHRT